MCLPIEPNSLSTSQFIELFKLKKGILREFILPADDSSRSRDIFNKLSFNKEVSADALLSVPTRFIDGILHIYSREIYAKDCEVREEKSYLPLVRNPLVDLEADLVFNCDWGGHEVVANAFMSARDPKSQNFYSSPSDYVLQGHGYYVSSVSATGLVVGKKVFDNDLLDEYDAMVMKPYKIHIIESYQDFQKMKGR